MRPERLALSAFGPFAGEQGFDFSELAAHRLFLIHGPTGAGKTTLLDALCFALFGSSSGDERQPAHLRSQHADGATPTWVELDFSLGPKRYRIRRSPLQPAIGRGGRSVAMQPKVTLWRREAEGWTVLGEQERRVRDEVERLLGYSEKEFRQVVVLPQGRFREVLTAKPGDRQAILATLFRTSLYARVEAQLAARTRAAFDEARRLDGHRATLLGQVGPGQAGAATPESAAELVEGLAEHVLLAASRTARLRAAAELAAARLVAAQQAARLLDLAAAANAKLALLRAREAAVAEDRLKLDAAGRAAGTLAADLVHAQVERQAAQARGDAERAADALLRAQARRDAAELGLHDEAARAGAIENGRADAGRLAAKARAARAAEDAEQRAGEAERRLDQVRQVWAAAAGSLERAQANRERARGLAADAERRAEQVPLLRAALTQARSLADDCATLDRVAARTSDVERISLQAHGRSCEATQRLDLAAATRQRAEAGVRAHHAAFLARRLAHGEACPVCGSAEHPAPHEGGHGELPDLDAALTGETVRRRELDAAQDAARRADDDLSRVREQVELLRRRVPDDLRRPAVTARVGEAEVAARVAEDAATALPRLADAAAAAAGRVEAANRDMESAREAVRAHQATVDGERGAIQALRLQAPAADGDSAGLARAAEAASLEATASSRALDGNRAEAAAAREALTSAGDDAQARAGRACEAGRAVAAARAHLETACRAAGFADPQTARAARLEPERIADMAAALASSDRELIQAEVAAAQASAAASGLATPDLPERESDDVLSRAAADAATAEEARLRERHLQAADLLAAILAADAGLAEARARHAMLNDIAETTAGKNDKRLSLEGFVLASILDEALAAANDHLGRMLGGRYRVQRRDEPLRANAAVGLDIEVCDDWTGQVRPAGTLSGGEGFCAALALALGLADTVQAHAGARRIDTLFIDEGFGSLDEDALNTAMDVLTRLQAGDRLVGIISHVAELRSRIPAQLVVRPGPRGSTAAFATLA